MNKHFSLSLLFGLIFGFASFVVSKASSNGLSNQSDIIKIKDIIIYEDSLYFSGFPSVVKNIKNEFILAFRRAPDWRVVGKEKISHVDPNSYLLMMKSRDGINWSKTPELLYAHPFGGSQDPCLLQLRNGNLLCTSYGWAFVKSDSLRNIKRIHFNVDGAGAVFLGGYILRSIDGGKKWQDPIYPMHVDAEINFSALGNPLPAFNRGALCEGKNGRIFWAVAVKDSIPINKTSTHLLVSDDKGLTWSHSAIVATDNKFSFNETSVYETPKGDLVAFLRTVKMGDQACIARSADGGKTFKWEKMGFLGHPLHALRLSDNRVLLTYGYRHKPHGVRARVLNAECTDFATAPEFILRDDGVNFDLGYPWSVILDKNRVLVVYYFNKNNGTRHIAGTILKIKKTK